MQPARWLPSFISVFRKVGLILARAFQFSGFRRDGSVLSGRSFGY